jgi:hypothetical protein
VVKEKRMLLLLEKIVEKRNYYKALGIIDIINLKFTYRFTKEYDIFL